MSIIVNEVWKYDTLFSCFSDCQRIFTNEFNFLLKNINDYSLSLEEVIQEIPEVYVSRGVSWAEHNNLPFWYHCDCGSKVRLVPRVEEDFLFGHGSCVKCFKEYYIKLGTKHNPDTSAIASNISAKAVPMILIFSHGLGLSCYVGGVGGKQYLNEAEPIARKLGVIMPPLSYWRPNDFYTSLSQFEALIEYNRISGNYEIDKWMKEAELLQSKINRISEEVKALEVEKNCLVENLRKNPSDIKIFEEKIKNISGKISKIKKESNLQVLQYNLIELKNIPKFVKILPSIIDYAVNLGLKETSDQWCSYLINNGSLSSDVNMYSILDKFIDSRLKDIFGHLHKLSTNIKDYEEDNDSSN